MSCRYFYKFTPLNWTCSHVNCGCNNNHGDHIQTARPGPLGHDLTIWLNLQHYRSDKKTQTYNFLCPWYFRRVSSYQIREMARVYISKFFRIRTNLKYHRIAHKKCKHMRGHSFQHHVILCLNNEIIVIYIIKSTSGRDPHLFYRSSNLTGSLESKQV